jgi:hypothetical protein
MGTYRTKAEAEKRLRGEGWNEHFQDHGGQ